MVLIKGVISTYKVQKSADIWVVKIFKYIMDLWINKKDTLSICYLVDICNAFKIAARGVIIFNAAITKYEHCNFC